MESNLEISGPINIGNPDEYKINTIANLILKMTNSPSKLVYKDLPLDDPELRQPCIDKAQKDLNWSPSTNLDEGLAKTIEYFKGIIIR